MTSRMPTLFTAHGNPMNALGGTRFSAFLQSWGRKIPRPEAILCISAHWERQGIAISATAHPETIHDFSGFPDALYDIVYPAPGAPEWAVETRNLLTRAGFHVDLDNHRGLDHGVWAPLRFLYPKADIPVFEMSLPSGTPFQQFPKIGRSLSPLRDNGVLILGSGNLVHNLSTVNFGDQSAPTPEWAEKFDVTVKKWLLTGDLQSLADPRNGSREGRISHPTLEHYAPILFIHGAADTEDTISFPYYGFEYGSISMRCVRFG